MAKFDSALRRLTEYINSVHKRHDIPLEDINREFVTGYEFWLKTGKNLSNNSALKQLKYLRKIIRIAQANRWIDLDPYNGLHFKKDEVVVEFLTRAELDRMRRKDFGIERLEQVRDVFVFCCFTGLAFIDVRQTYSRAYNYGCGRQRMDQEIEAENRTDVQYPFA